MLKELNPLLHSELSIQNSELIKIPIPIKKYTFQDSLYKIQIEGYKVRPLSIDVYPQTKYITTNTSTTIAKPPRRINLGIIAGYGILIPTNGTPPQKGITLGLGISFRLW